MEISSVLMGSTVNSPPPTAEVPSAGILYHVFRQISTVMTAFGVSVPGKAPKLGEDQLRLDAPDPAADVQNDLYRPLQRVIERQRPSLCYFFELAYTSLAVV